MGFGSRFIQWEGNALYFRAHGQRPQCWGDIHMDAVSSAQGCNETQSLPAHSFTVQTSVKSTPLTSTRITITDL